jgi:hypothetical protein
MAKKQDRKKPLIERIQDRIRDFLDGVAEAIDSLIAPPPQPVRIPIRR